MVNREKWTPRLAKRLAITLGEVGYKFGLERRIYLRMYYYTLSRLATLQYNRDLKLFLSSSLLSDSHIECGYIAVLPLLGPMKS